MYEPTQTNTPATNQNTAENAVVNLSHPENFSETSGNANIDRYIDESIRAQDEGKKQPQTNVAAESGDAKTQSNTSQQSRDATNTQSQGNSGENTPPQPQQPQPQQLHPHLTGLGLKEDKDGNLVDKDNKIIAHVGGERRQFERAENFANQNKHAQAYIKRLENDLAIAAENKDTANYLHGMPQQLGLNHAEVATGLNIVSTWKKNPHEAIKFLLTEYAAMGHNVNELLGKEGGIDLGAVQTMINRAVQPLVGTQQQQQGQQQAYAQAERQYNAFMAKYPEAAVHENEIASLMARDKTLTADGAFHMLKAWALEQRLDFSRPLGPQFQAAPQSVQGRNIPPTQGSNQTQMNNVPPLPNGRGTPEAALNAHQNVARADDDWDSIIKGEIKRSGYNA